MLEKGSNSLCMNPGPMIGRGYRARTDDIHLVRVALYQIGL